MLRRATMDDADAIVRILRAAHAAQPWYPHRSKPEETERFVRGQLLAETEVWVTEHDGRVVAYLALRDDLLQHLFVHPDAQGTGVGSEALDHVKTLRPGGFTLWTHQANEQARRFYERRGLTVLELTDGATTMERLPDVRYGWTPESDARSRAAGSRSSPRRSR